MSAATRLAELEQRLAEARGSVALIEETLAGEAEARLGGDRDAAKRGKRLRDQRDEAEQVIDDIQQTLPKLREEVAEEERQAAERAKIAAWQRAFFVLRDREEELGEIDRLIVDLVARVRIVDGLAVAVRELVGGYAAEAGAIPPAREAVVGNLVRLGIGTKEGLPRRLLHLDSVAQIPSVSADAHFAHMAIRHAAPSEARSLAAPGQKAEPEPGEVTQPKPEAAEADA